VLSTLQITNLAIIDSLEIRLEPGLNIFTGETGAGKSIILNALSLVLGERASVELIRAGQACARVQALFEVGADKRIEEVLTAGGLPFDEGTVLISRELSREGKNRCWINGTLVPLSVLREIGDLLVDLHGQHDHQRLLNPAHHLEIVDTFGDAAFHALRERVQTDVGRMGEIRRELDAIAARAAERAAQLELATAQLEELTGAGVDPVADAQVEAKLRLLGNLEKVRREAQEVVAALTGDDAERPGALTTLRALSPRVDWLCQTTGDATLTKAGEIFREATYLLDDAASTIGHTIEGLEFDEEEMQQVQDRYAVLHKLKRKYGPELEDVVARMVWLESQVADLNRVGEDRSRLEAELGEVLTRSAADVAKLSVERKKIVRKLEERVGAHLIDLGLEHARFKVELGREEDPDSPLALDGVRVHVYRDGVDRVEFFIAPNPGEPLKALARTASGGELSRLMLAVKCSLAVLDRVPIMVFDEIDTGIGGTTAVKVAGKLRQVSKTCQSLVITHLPQIASAGACHFAVEKVVEGGRTRTAVRRLSHEERIDELHRMLGGAAVKRAHAVEMLAGFADKSPPRPKKPSRTAHAPHHGVK
jgi:DNA repair protein RecN (Recombination protein N)